MYIAGSVFLGLAAAAAPHCLWANFLSYALCMQIACIIWQTNEVKLGSGGGCNDGKKLSFMYDLTMLYS